MDENMRGRLCGGVEYTAWSESGENVSWLGW